jgi:hypothetical protein
MLSFFPFLSPQFPPTSVPNSPPLFPSLPFLSLFTPSQGLYRGLVTHVGEGDANDATHPQQNSPEHSPCWRGERPTGRLAVDTPHTGSHTLVIHITVLCCILLL